MNLYHNHYLNQNHKHQYSQYPLFNRYPNNNQHPENNQLQKAIFGGTRKVSNVGMAPQTRVVMEVQSVIAGGGNSGQPRFESIGWTALDFFSQSQNGNGRLELNSGLHRLPLQRGSIQWHNRIATD